MYFSLQIVARIKPVELSNKGIGTITKICTNFTIHISFLLHIDLFTGFCDGPLYLIFLWLPATETLWKQKT